MYTCNEIYLFTLPSNQWWGAGGGARAIKPIWRGGAGKNS